MSLTLTKDRYGYPVQGKREGTSPHQQAPVQAPTRQETADRSNVLRGQVGAFLFPDFYPFYDIVAGTDKEGHLHETGQQPGAGKESSRRKSPSASSTHCRSKALQLKHSGQKASTHLSVWGEHDSIKLARGIELKCHHY